ncbi:nitric oxide dioxygenase [Brevibacterium pityocampae]
MSTSDLYLDEKELDSIGLTPEHEEIIKATLPLVGSKINEITPIFYSRMFEAHPELIADTFNRGNQKQGAQQRALAASVATFATMLVDPEAPAPVNLLSRIGHKHVSLGITKDQYQIVHDNLFAAIVEVLGEDVVTPDVAAAWDSVYWLMADVLTDFEYDLYRSARVEPGDVFRATTVVDRRDLPGDIVHFTVRAAEGSADLPGHLPGQYVSVGARLPDGARQLRQYSLVRGGSAAGELSFAVKRIRATESAPEGEVSNWLGENVQVGDSLEVTLPAGDLVLDAQATNPVVLISAGIGVTPMLGMLDSLAASGSARTVVALHADDSAEVDAFGAARTGYAAGLAEGSAITWYGTGTPDAELQGEVREGLMDLSAVELPESASVYICGSNGFLQFIRTQLDERGVAAADVHYELFAPNDWLLDA